LQKDDIDFIILGCDGIYDQLSNEEILDSETKPTKVVSKKPEDFEIHYGFKPGAVRIALGVASIVAMVGGVALSFVYPKYGVPVCLAGAVGVGFSLMKKVGGKVEFYVNPEYVPENAKKIERVRKEIAENKVQIEILEEKIKTGLESSTAELKNKVRTVLDTKKKELQTLEHFVSFEKSAHDLYENRKEDIKQFFDLVQQFYPNQTSFTEFVSLYEKVIGKKIEQETDENNVSLNSLECSDLEKKYANFFSDVWNCQ